MHQDFLFITTKSKSQGYVTVDGDVLVDADLIPSSVELVNVTKGRARLWRTE